MLVQGDLLRLAWRRGKERLQQRVGLAERGRTMRQAGAHGGARTGNEEQLGWKRRSTGNEEQLEGTSNWKKDCKELTITTKQNSRHRTLRSRVPCPPRCLEAAHGAIVRGKCGVEAPLTPLSLRPSPLPLRARLARRWAACEACEWWCDSVPPWLPRRAVVPSCCAVLVPLRAAVRYLAASVVTSATVCVCVCL